MWLSEPAGMSGESGNPDVSVSVLTGASAIAWHPARCPQGRDVILGNETLPNERAPFETQCVSSPLDQPLPDTPVLQGKEKEELIRIGQLVSNICAE